MSLRSLCNQTECCFVSLFDQECSPLSIPLAMGSEQTREKLFMRTGVLAIMALACTDVPDGSGPAPAASSPSAPASAGNAASASGGSHHKVQD